MNRIQIGEQRYYHFEGKKYPSVTTILKNGLPKPIELELWELYMGSEAEEIRDIRSFIGTLAHYRLASTMAAKHGLPMPELQLHRLRKFDGTTTQILNAIAKKCEEWIELYKPIALRVEHTVVNREIGYAGTLDLLARLLDRAIFLIDFKTSKAVYEEHVAQVAAYVKCFNPLKLKAGILRINEESAEFKVLDEREIERGFELFLKAKKNFDRAFLGRDHG